MKGFSDFKDRIARWTAYRIHVNLSRHLLPCLLLWLHLYLVFPRLPPKILQEDLMKQMTKISFVFPLISFFFLLKYSFTCERGM